MYRWCCFSSAESAALDAALDAGVRQGLRACTRNINNNMIRQPLEFLLASSTTAKVNRFLQETQLSDGMVNRSDNLESSPLELASTPELDVSVQDASSNFSKDHNNNNKYKQMLRYMPNSDFRGELSSIGASVPNTFKHKSHPNARTKHHIGLLFEDDSSHMAASEPSANPVKTSTLRGVNLSNIDEMVEQDEGNTPSWMPPVLEQKWEDSESPEARRLQGQQSRGKDLGLDFLNLASNTFVHNPPAEAATPMWKRLTKDYQTNLNESPLQQIFISNDDLNNSEHKSRHNSKAGRSAFALLSTISTPLATRETDIHLTQQQINRLEDILEQAKDKPDDYQIKGSPLKLFGSEYDTFTKSVLSKFVEKVRSNANSVQREPLPVQAQLAVPKLKIKNFIKSGDYTDQDFMKNANSLFANIQKNYNPGNVFENPNLSVSFQKSTAVSNSLNTATSTPKLERVGNVDELTSLKSFSSYSTDFDENSSAEEMGFDHQESSSGDRNEYTSIERTYLANSMRDFAVESDMNSNEADSFTFDETSHSGAHNSTEENAFPVREETPVGGAVPKERQDAIDNPRLNFDTSQSSVKQYGNVGHKFDRHNSSELSSVELGRESFVQPIKWKRASQLRLLSTDSNKANIASRNSHNQQISKGTVGPGDYPEKFGDMIFDYENHRWISNDQENDHRGSLDSIEDLHSETSDNGKEYLTREISILKLAKRGARKTDKNLEVSFHVPEVSSHSKSRFNVTNLSDLMNVSFSQSNRNLVSMITGSTDESEWEKIKSLDLSNKLIERVEDLDHFLPALTSVDLSNNMIRFIEGLPQGIFELQIANNKLDNITTFRKFRDLQVLNASYNSLSNLSGLRQNIHLTKVDLGHNRIASIEDLLTISSLTKLAVNHNRISGKIDFSKSDLPNLQELDLSENRIESVTGLESLPNLRVLNLNDNKLKSITCGLKHQHLKKMLLKYNKLEKLDLQPFPFLRVLRVDGNPLINVEGLGKLKLLQEIAAKCQISGDVVKSIFEDAYDLLSLDLSGNSMITTRSMISTIPNCFMNLNQLNLSAISLTVIPPTFSEKFPNVRELNLNFNKLTELSGLSELTRLRKLFLVSNNIGKIELLLSALKNSRESLKVLDMRLNVLNFEFYPYVFSPEELEHMQPASSYPVITDSPIPLETMDDIESFASYYNTLIKSKDWEERDSEFVAKLRSEGNLKRVRERLNYETIFVNFFPHLRELDGKSIDRQVRLVLKSRYMQLGERN